ncbi:hypothetical protein BV22DRAFT_1051233 [Leucogyrophana mollusca]|uniref:Uncharacterized protein n=1 Tax=Leucogyrophana mollusca TaxID=85980 RepID=A0ACB8B187_9AGAM|nr:hypothetical protein BV22DRAFT_1051233 [Leucogyrophana mollusca]
MCTIFDVIDGKHYAVTQLEYHVDLDLATKLQLCHQYKIVDWLAPVIKKLVSLPIETLVPVDLEKVPTKILHTLIQDTGSLLVEQDLVDERIDKLTAWLRDEYIAVDVKLHMDFTSTRREIDV